MGFVDAISPEDRVEVKFSEFYNLVEYKVMATMLLNGIRNEVEYDSIHKVITGKPLHEEESDEK